MSDSRSPPSPRSLPLPSSPPPPHPDSKISPAPSKGHHSTSSNDAGRTTQRNASPSPGTDTRYGAETSGKLLWRDQIDLGGDMGRRPSVQFATDQSEALLRNESPKPKARNVVDKGKPGRRLSSPPPPPAHQQRVSFDTFANPDVSTWSYSFRSDHKDYDYSSTGRTFLVGTDENDYSEYALEWLLDEMVDDNDMVICLRVVLKEPKSISSSEEKRYKAEAGKLLKHLQSNAGERKIALILEFAAGKVQENIMRMIELYEPNFLVVGTRGRSLNGLQGLLPGSVSKWCVQNSPIPVVVARKESKRKKSKAVRQADPSRRSYQALLASTAANGHSSTSNILASHGHGSLTPDHNAGNAATAGGTNLDGTTTGQALSASNLRNLSLVANSQAEADAVARAIGLPTEYSASTILKRRSSRASATSATDYSSEGEGFALGRHASARSEDYEVESPSPTGPLRDEDGGEYFPGGSAAGAAEGETGPEVNVEGAKAENGEEGGMVVPTVRLERQATDLDLAGHAHGDGRS